MDVNTKLRQAKAAMVAEFALRQRLQRIQWEEEVLKPAMEQLALDAGHNLEIPEFLISEDDD